MTTAVVYHPAEVPLAFERHATSKLNSIDDLFSVRTLGFRGEALASIAAVSRLSLITRAAEQSAGTQIRYEGGFRKALQTAGAPQGTVITVENLFYNVPARLKFLKADSTEAGHIRRAVQHYALAYPEIRFALIQNGRQVFQTDGNGALYDVLVAVWDLETAKQMIPIVDLPDAAVQVSGYIGAPSLHRGQRDQLIFFVNRRWIQDRALAHAVVQAYHTLLPVGRHPVAVVNLSLDPNEVDVNVHPTKAEVKFKTINNVFRAVQEPVRLTVTEQAPMVRSAQTLGATDDWNQWSSPTWAEMRNQGGRGVGFSQMGFEAQRTLSPEGGFEGEQAFEIGAEIDDTHLPPLRVIGQIQQMYIITEGPDGLYLIDQHAAHERIQYDRMMAQQETGQTISQRLLEPILLNLSPAQAIIVEAEIEALIKAGFELEPFGGDSFRLLAIPEILAQEDPQTAFGDVLAQMAEGGVPLAKETHEKVAIIVCKRASIKAGQTLSATEMQALVRQLEQSTHPRTCPHGRPTMIHLSAYQLAKEFGRH